MATVTRVEQSMGIDKCVIQTVTQQSLSGEIAKNAEARSYREDQVDGVYTLVEEIIIEQGEPQFSFDGSIGTEPLETHPLFNGGANTISAELKAKWATYKKNPADTFLAGWKPAEETDENFVVFYNYIKQGVESYYVGRVTARVTVLETGAPNMLLLGAIDAWGGGWPDGFAPPQGTSFLLSGVRSQQEGVFYRTTYEYTSSPAGTQWDLTLYGFSQ
jgi:hypothetical protein